MRIGAMMSESGVTFGTSGARGRVSDMTDRVCYAYAAGFLQYAMRCHGLRAGAPVGLAGDYRASSGRIMAACARAVTDSGCVPRNLGRIPTPALAAFGLAQGMPTMMVTGSHIPDDRNGIKYNLPTGEILKHDEQAIREEDVALPDGLFDAAGGLVEPAVLPPEERLAHEAYVARYLEFFPADCLDGLRVGLYEHSSVAREALYELLTGLGATVERLGFSETFIPVDTEAIRPEDVALARNWAADGRFDALVSTDGDGDRPLVGDERGDWLRGDVAGVLVARALGARAVVTPVSSNTVVERCGWFAEVVRTRIGSPYVIEAMQAQSARGVAPVVGYEANGGFLINSDLQRDDKRLPALPTRDAVIVVLAILAAAKASGKPLSQLADALPARFTHSDRIKAFPTAISARRLAMLDSGDSAADKHAIDALFGAHFGPVASVDRTDGLRMTFRDGDIVHLRPSGNAPELRAYTEAASAERARAMNAVCMEILAGWREQG
ncbi:phosphomannomutase [Thiohalocapsa marina]|uniref:Phosphomannomutase n=1 Tax=Thiohalocapsa marina TaxID=424902 RepID=A0A5M8FFI7_9GAMM|nr:phosphomannomutase [Thiohalocapsa marina]KAA6183643.1 phosphomannomutase [Thiohalocapsa marina]